MTNFYTDVICKDDRFLSPTRINDVELLEPVTRTAIANILAKAELAGTPLQVFETYRSQTRQAQLYKTHATQLATVGVHHYGLAADLVRVVDGNVTWAVDYTFLKELAESENLVWGGDWGDSTIKHSFVDLDHVQRINVSAQVPLFSGGWFPDDDYLPTIK